MATATRTATKSIDLTRKKIIFREELTYVLSENFVACVPVPFFFHGSSFSPFRPLLAASISHFLTAAMKFSVFFFQRNSSPLFLITRSSSFSVIQVSVDKTK